MTAAPGTDRQSSEREHAERMLAVILAHREHEGRTDYHPLDTLDMDDPLDRRIVGWFYAELARAGIIRH